MENQEKITVTVSQLQREFVTLAGKVTTALIPIFVYSIVQLIRLGNHADYLWLLVGCILSVITMMGYIIVALTYGVKNKKSYLAMLLTFAGIFTWIFGSYLVFIDGFWKLKDIINGFSIIIILKSVIFIYLGYVVVSKFYLIAEIGKNISGGFFDIESE